MRFPLRFHLFPLLRSLTLACVAVAPLTLPALCESASEVSPAASGPPQVLALAFITGGPIDQVSLNYSTAVPDSRVLTDLETLKQLTGWKLDGLKIDTKQIPGVPGAVPSTSASFSTPGVLNPQTGQFPVNPFIFALKRFRRIQLHFLAYGPLNVTGPPASANRWVNVGFFQSGTFYQYNVEVLDNRFTISDLSPAPPGQGLSHSDTRRGAAMIGAALCFGIALYFIVRTVIKSNRERG